MTGSILWLKVGDEVLIPGRLTDSEASRLFALFDRANPASPWNRAISRLGMAYPAGTADESVLRIVNGTPYFNGTLMSVLVSRSSVRAKEAPGGGITYEKTGGIFSVFRLLGAQWALERFLSSISSELPAAAEARIEESLALGLAVQALMMRLPAHSEEQLAAWLAQPGNAPAAARGAVEKILTVQARRSLLSSAWQGLYEADAPRGNNKTAEPPKFFWNEPPAGTSASVPVSDPTGDATGAFRDVWKGISICPGEVEGELLLLAPEEAVPSGSQPPLVLAFAKARPETTELFGQASAIVFAEGGALAHACCIAREQGVPCVSGLGRPFLAELKRRREAGLTLRVLVNGSSGELRWL